MKCTFSKLVRLLAILRSQVLSDASQASPTLRRSRNCRSEFRGVRVDSLMSRSFLVELESHNPVLLVAFLADGGFARAFHPAIVNRNIGGFNFLTHFQWPESSRLSVGEHSAEVRDVHGVFSALFICWVAIVNAMPIQIPQAVASTTGSLSGYTPTNTPTMKHGSSPMAMNGAEPFTEARRRERRAVESFFGICSFQVVAAAA